MRNLFFTLAFFTLAFGAKAQTTITIYGEATVTIDDKVTTIKCDRFYQSKCMELKAPVVIVKNFAQVTAFRNNSPIYSMSGIVKSYEPRESSNYSEYKFTFED